MVNTTPKEQCCTEEPAVVMKIMITYILFVSRGIRK